MQLSDDQTTLVRDQIRKIEASGALGRGNAYLRLLEYLAEAATAGRVPKEYDIALDVFERDANFDPGQSSLVRVNAHHLRGKLKRYYSGPGRGEAWRLSIPRGEYRVAIESVAQAPAKAQSIPEGRLSEPSNKPLRLAALVCGCLLLGGTMGWLLRSPAAPTEVTLPGVSDSSVWQPILSDKVPVLVVVGDYYIFGVKNDGVNVDHLMRDFTINSVDDLDHLMMLRPKLMNRYVDLNLTYLPRGAAFALRDLLHVLFTAGKSVRVVTMAEFDAADLRRNHVIYVGYVSGMGMLYDIAFESSSLRVGATYDELVDRETGKAYYSDAIVLAPGAKFRDYGLVSTFPGPGGLQFMVVAGTRDAGLMQAALAVSDADHLRMMEQAAPKAAPGQAPAFEVLYQVVGLNRTNLDATIVHTAQLAPFGVAGSRPGGSGDPATHD